MEIIGVFHGLLITACKHYKCYILIPFVCLLGFNAHPQPGSFRAESTNVNVMARYTVVRTAILNAGWLIKYQDMNLKRKTKFVYNLCAMLKLPAMPVTFTLTINAD